MTDPAAPDVQALLALSEEDIQALPPEVAGMVAELIQSHQDAAKQQEQDRLARLAALGQRVVGLYNERLGQRNQLELRWLRDIRRYNGEYEPEDLKVLQGRDFGSRAFVPLTRRVIDIVEARMVDLLFPTNERGFAIRPSPSPDLMQAEALAAQLPAGHQINVGGQTMMANAVKMALREIREEAASKAAAMQREIDDQLQEADYAATCRQVIHDAMVVGTGVLKGPHVVSRTKRAWINGSLVVKEELKPTTSYVSFWNFFPDMSARSLKDSESDVERHYLTKANFAKLAGQPGFEMAANDIRRILSSEGAARADANVDQLRIASGSQGVKDPRYLVLEFHGPVERQELIDAGLQVPDDNLLVYEGIVWVYEDGTVLKAAIEPMDTCERPYSTFCWRKDPGSIFGFGLSYEVADIQETANSTYRASLDNAGLSVGGMVCVNDKVVYPENGKWTIEPNKVWRGKKADADMRAAFTFVEIPNNLQPLLALFDRSKQLLDDIGGPAMAMQGQEAPSYLDTARGASIAHNAANIWFRRGVAQWDDDMTSPTVGRFVSWNMQYSENDSIKGDWNVEARGRSALLEAEAQAQRLLFFAQISKDVPLPFEYKLAHLREIALALRLDPSDVLPDEAEGKILAQKIDSQPPPTDPGVARLKLGEAELQDKQVQRQHDAQLEQQRASLALAEIASREKITLADAQQRYGLEWASVQAQIQDRQAGRDHQTQMLNAKLASDAMHKVADRAQSDRQAATQPPPGALQ